MKDLEKVLHVEDDESIRAVAKVAIEQVGKLTLLSCASGQVALDEVVEYAPDLILLDVMMPEMDGPQTLIELKKMMDLSQIPVLFMTAKIQPEEKQRYLDLGAFSVIDKPFNPMTLSAELQRCWDLFHQACSD
ncbi:MAG: hypothetical protein DSZ27_03750 [Thiomicrospira sp.]|nr:MAG: hypothetical protein DSZ27_03750 [Thiomicrospira sp.]